MNRNSNDFCSMNDGSSGRVPSSDVNLLLIVARLSNRRSDKALMLHYDTVLKNIFLAFKKKNV